ncbi:hypothetical protein ACJX0J_042112, partial [Zea mays]
GPPMAPSSLVSLAQGSHGRAPLEQALPAAMDAPATAPNGELHICMESSSPISTSQLPFLLPSSSPWKPKPLSVFSSPLASKPNNGAQIFFSSHLPWHFPLRAALIRCLQPPADSPCCPVGAMPPRPLLLPSAPQNSSRSEPPSSIASSLSPRRVTLLLCSLRSPIRDTIDPR